MGQNNRENWIDPRLEASLEKRFDGGFRNSQRFMFGGQPEVKTQISVFAEHGTDRKAIIHRREDSNIQDILAKLESQHSGKWYLVENLANDEIIVYHDNLKYLGFHGGKERYASNIHKLMP